MTSLLSHFHAASFKQESKSVDRLETFLAMDFMLTSPSCALRASRRQIREQRSVLVTNEEEQEQNKWPELTQ